MIDNKPDYKCPECGTGLFVPSMPHYCEPAAKKGPSEPETTISDAGPGDGFPTGYHERKEYEMWTYLLEYMPDALMAELEVAIAGNRQHNPGQHLHWARGKSTDQLNTAFRHMWAHTMAKRWGRGSMIDADKCWHLAKAIWRLRAELQLTLERVRRDNARHSGGLTNGDTHCSETARDAE